MSYDQVSGYYSRTARQSSQNYGIRRGSAEASNPYANHLRTNDNRQPNQYPSSAYNWSGHAQPATRLDAQNEYGNESNWRDTSAVSYEYQRQGEVYVQPNPATTSAPAYSNGSRSTQGQDTQGLNHLAYASGLEHTSARAPSNGRPAALQNTNYTSNSASQSAVAPNRIRSPVENPRRVVQSPAPNPMQKDRSTSSASSQSLAVNAAAALAKAVSHRFPDSSQQYGNQRVTSSALTSSQAHNTSQGTNPLYAAAATVQTTGRSSVADVMSSRTVPVKPQSARPELYGHDGPTPESQSQNTIRSSAQHTNSIANLVSAGNGAEEEIYESNEHQNSMPNFIDPTQVFNPYHREHERKKREAAEAEAKRIAEEKHQSEKARISEESNKRHEREAVANSKSKVKRKPVAPVQGDVEKSQSTPAVSEKEAMAAEMKAFMDRMKEFRSKDPTTFSQLWNDMRGKDNSNQANSAEEDLVSPRVLQAALPTAPISTINASKTAASTAPPQARKAGVTALPNTIQNPIPGVPFNGYRVTVLDNPEGLPDLGKYPALRRIRGTYNKADQSKTYEASPTPIYPVASISAMPAPTPAPVRPDNCASEACPEPRRRAVAIAAIHLLKSLPENAQNPITAQDIASMLERNPSYLDLCSALELRGLKFQKNSFAKDLLKNVPDLNKSSSDQGPPEGTTAQEDPHAKPWTEASVQNSVANPSFISYSSSTALPVKSESAEAKIKQSRRKVSNASYHQEPLPGTKEAAARKRDFSELVDLTELNDNEDYVMPSKKQRLLTEEGSMLHGYQGSQSGHPRISSTSTSTGFVTMPTSLTPLKFNTQSHSHISTASALQPTDYTPPRLTSLQPAYKQQKKMIIAERMKNSEALHKSYYDPRTVARDVLIASGRHPSERPLNAHLIGMLNQYIESDSDLSTLDWDAVDPGGPPVRKIEYVDIPAERPKFKLRERKQQMTSPQFLSKNATRVPKEVRQDPASLSPVPLIAPASDSNKPAKLKHSLYVGSNHSTHPAVTAAPSHRKISVNIPTDRSSRQSVSRSVTDSVDISRTVEMDTEHTTKKRIGRPPGAKNKHPSLALLRKQANAVRMDLPVQEQATVQPEKMVPVLPEYKCKWIRCSAKLHNLATLRMHVPKRHVPSPEDSKPVAYICWWKNCPLLSKQDDGIVPTKAFDNKAEWLEHIEENHIQPLGRVYGDGPSTFHNGKQRLDLDKFIYNCPVGPLARIVSYTDSQRAETVRDRCLTDENGRSTTPAVALDGSPNLPTDTLELTRVYPTGPKSEKEKADVTAQNAYMKAHGSKSSDQKRRAVETVRAMTTRKERIGPGIDRGGCTLINEERRATLIQNPGLVRIIEAEY